MFVNSLNINRIVGTMRRRPPDCAPRQAFILLALCALLCPALPADGASTIPQWSERRVFTLTARAVTAGAVEPLVLRIDPDRGARGRFDLAWPEPGAPVSIELIAHDRSTAMGEAPRAEVQAIVRRPDGSERHATRRISGESGTALFEIDRAGDRGLVVGLSWESELEPVVNGPPSIGAPVRFRLEIERALGGKVYPLESNQLNSFVGEPVGYAFRLGQGDDVEALRIRLLPIFIEGDVLSVDIEIEGRLPGEAAPQAIAQRRRTLLSNGAATIVPVGDATGEEATIPDGYRFRVRALF